MRKAALRFNYDTAPALVKRVTNTQVGQSTYRLLLVEVDAANDASTLSCALVVGGVAYGAVYITEAVVGDTAAAELAAVRAAIGTLASFAA